MSQMVIKAIDAANAADPNRVKHAGQELAKESLYSIRKTWQKMSNEAHEFVLAGNISLPEPLKPIITKALS